MTILVTGATGHIGNVLVRELIERGEAVRVLVIPGEDLRPLQGLPVEVCTGDVLHLESLQSAMVGVSNVFHLAGIISIMPGKNDHLWDVNLQGTRNVLHAARLAGVRRIIYTSSIHALQPAPHGVTVDESLPFDPGRARGEYDRSKATASLVVQEAARQGLDVVIVCPTGVIGPYDYRGSEMGCLVAEILAGRLNFTVGGAYDFVDVRDVARGMILAWHKGRAGEVYLLSGEQITVERLIDSVQEQAGGRKFRLRLPFNLAIFASQFAPLHARFTGKRPLFTRYSLETLVSNSVVSSEKARRELGYNPRPLGETLADTVAWQKNLRKMG